MTRKRVRESLMQTLCDTCSYCGGKGHIKSHTTICNEIIRAIQRICLDDNLFQKHIKVETHPAIYDLFFEEESAFIEKVEQQHSLEINFVVNPKLHQEKYNISLL